MPKVKYRGPGITAIGVDFKAGEYDLSEKAAKYVLDTFSPDFELVSGKEKAPKVEVVPDDLVKAEEVVETPEEPKKGTKGLFGKGK